jgi:glycosyltransferase involved in cell wall biosynthesis
MAQSFRKGCAGNPDPMLISVLVITFNHERFIEAALNSALAQVVNADLEIVVGEDCSTDRTREILAAYRHRHPATIRLLLRDRNIGLVRNFAETLLACRGRYIALLEGDDFWTSPDKLRKQVEFLERHPQCSACFHNVEVIYDDSARSPHPFHRMPLPKTFFTLRDVLSWHFIPTPSTMLRAGLFSGLPDWFYAMPMGDWPLHVLNAQQGPIGYIDEVLATYRVHGGGAWSLQGRVATLAATIHAAETMGAHLDRAYDDIISKSVARWEREIASIHYRDGRYAEALWHARSSMKRSPSFGRSYRKALSLWVKSAALNVAHRSRFGFGESSK